MRTVKTDSFTLEVEDNAAVLCATHNDNADGNVVIKGNPLDVLAVLSILSGAVAKVLIDEHETPPQEAIKLTCKAVIVGVNDWYKDIDEMLMKQEVQ